MSQENVDVVRRMFGAYAEGDNNAALDAFGPQVEFEMTFRPDGGVFRGPQGVAEAMRIWTGAFEDWAFEIKELIDAGDAVLVVLRESGRGKGSGIEIDQVTFLVPTLRNGKIIHMEGYIDRDKALEAVGPRE